MSDASLSFLPWARQGAAAAITVDDALGLSKQKAVAEIVPTLTVNEQQVSGIAVRLRGPADVIGIDANQVVRTDPQPGTANFEPNCFAAIEFDRPDFPWLFTPARANGNARLRPWLCLVVVRRQDGVSVSSPPDVPLPVLRIAAPANVAVELPDLKDSWTWAHVQVASDASTEASVRPALNGAPELALSRLVCPRLLEPGTDYVACVVPAFDLGRRAGLGLPIADSELAADNGLIPAWTFPAIPPPVPPTLSLPVYFQWAFRTGPGGDFESLARALKAAVPAGLGRRAIDISQPGFAAGGATTVQLEGALLPINNAAQTPDPIPPAFKNALAGIINAPGQAQAAQPGTDPLLAPPIYGRWHAARATVEPTGTAWLDQLNLDPRWRVAAACGTRVVQEHQEALMASAWEQAAEAAAANQRLRQLQLSLAVGRILHTRHFSVLSEEMVLRIAAPAFGRLKHGAEPSMLTRQMGTRLPVAANRSAMRRIGRQRGPLSRRVAADGFERSPSQTWVARLNGGMGEQQAVAMAAARQASQPSSSLSTPPPSDFAVLPTLPGRPADYESFFGAFFVAAENAPVTAPGEPVPKGAAASPQTEIPGFFRAAARRHLTRFFPPRSTPGSANVTPAFEGVKQMVLDRIEPQAALAALAGAVVVVGPNTLAPTAPGTTPVGLETVMAAPSFPQPMYEALRDLSQELLLPGLDKVEPDTVLGLKTNRPFIEAYLVGLNHEIGRELLWRGYPTDQRGTCFSHFWGRGVPNVAPADITALHTWSTRALGSAIGAPPLTEEFVMLMRSSLLRRYPNAVIYLAPALHPGTPPDPGALAPNLDPQQEVLPIFSGSMPADMSFFGFPVSTAAAIGGPHGDGGLGYYVVIQEHPTEPRFGLDVGIRPAGASHLAVGTAPPAGVNIEGHTWGKNAAEMAAILRRLPVRIAIHASRLITPA